MTSSELRTIVERVLGTVPFAPPVTQEYCASVQASIKALAPGALVDVHHRLTVLVVEARLDRALHRVEVPLA